MKKLPLAMEWTIGNVARFLKYCTTFELVGGVIGEVTKVLQVSFACSKFNSFVQ